MVPPSSVVIPTFARPAALDRCLEGLARQSVGAGEFEVVVVDDGSPTPISPAQGFGGRFEFRILRQDNAGPGVARNVGATAARGETLAFIDDDCVPDPGWLESLAGAVRRRPGVLAGGSTRNGLEGSLCPEVTHLIVSVAYDYYNQADDGPRFFATNNLACRRDDFLASGGFDPAFRVASEDREFCDRWAVQGRPMAWVPEANVAHFHEQGLGDFLRLHARYGRGAYRYHATRRARGAGSMRDGFGFHSTFVSRFRRLAPQGRSLGWHARAAGLLLAWQGANAAGFLREMLGGGAIASSARASGGAPDSPPSARPVP